jgi:hypothetical protein
LTKGNPTMAKKFEDLANDIVEIEEWFIRVVLPCLNSYLNRF